MAIAFRAATTAGNATGGSLTINKPTGTLDNDILVLVVYSEGGASSITPPTGFTQLGTTQANTGTAVMWLGTYWKRAASEGTSYSIGISPSAWRVAALASFSGCTTSGSPVDTFTSHTDSNTSVTAATITTTVANAMVVVTMGNFSGTDQTAGTSGMTLASGGNLGGCDIFYVLQATAGATGTKTFSPGQGVASQDVVYTLDLIPSTGTSVTVTPTAASAGAAAPAPTVSATQSATVTPSAAAAGSAGPAPTISTSGNATVSVSAPGAAGSSGPAPTVSTGTSANVTPTPGSAGASSPAPAISAVQSPTVSVQAPASAGAGGTAGTAGQTQNNHLITIGNGYTDANPRAVTRTSDGRLWVSSWQFDSYPQGSANGLTQTLRMYKADQTGTPSSFTRMDSAHEAVGVVSWAMAVDGSDTLHLIYTTRASWSGSTGTDNVLAYNTFNTATGLWGTATNLETALGVTEIGQGDELVALAVDSTGVPHIVYLKSDGTRRRVTYRNRAGGTWSAAVTVDDQTFGSNEKCWHPNITFDTAGRIVVTWQRGDFNGNATGRIFVRVNTSGVWGTTVDVAGANTWIGIDQSASLYIDPSNRYHIAYLDGSVNEYLQYRYSDNQGSTWTSNHPASGTGQGHNPVVGPGPGGVVRYLTHNATTTEITYFQGAGGSSAWASRVDYETPTGYDCSVNVRWCQYFWNNPLAYDIVYWKSDYPTNVLVLGTDVSAQITPSPAATGSALLPAPVVSIGTNATVAPSPAAAGGTSPAPAITAGTGVTVTVTVPAAAGPRAPAPSPSGSAQVNPSPSSAGGAMPLGPTISTSGNVNVTAAPGTGGAASPAPTPSGSASVLPAAAQTGGAVLVPAISTTANPTVFAAPAIAGGAAPAPLVFGNAQTRITWFAFVLTMRYYDFTLTHRSVDFSLTSRTITLEMIP